MRPDENAAKITDMEKKNAKKRLLMEYMKKLPQDEEEFEDS